MGRTTGDVGLFAVKRRMGESALATANSAVIMDGSRKGHVWGTYIHGIFDNDGFRHGLVNALRMKRGLPIVSDAVNFAKARDHALDEWSEILQKNIDMEFIHKLIGQ